MTDESHLQWLKAPNTLLTRREVITAPSPIPRKRGIYACYFKQIPGDIPTTNCLTYNGLTLLYLGICPGRAKGGKPLSDRTMYQRLVSDHMKGNAEGSTLRLTLGILLAEQTGFPLRCIQSRSNAHKPKNKLRKTFTNRGEQALDDWLNENIFMTWQELDQPWLLEEQLILELSVPLNLQGNKQHAFHSELSQLRSDAKKSAVEADAVIDNHART